MVTFILLRSQSFEISDHNLSFEKTKQKKQKKEKKREVSNSGNISFVCILFRFLRYVVDNVFVGIEKLKNKNQNEEEIVRTKIGGERKNRK